MTLPEGDDVPFGSRDPHALLGFSQVLSSYSGLMVSETGVDWKTYFVPLDRSSQKFPEIRMDYPRSKI